MTISIWRYSHLLLAIASSLFLVIASVTGVILAVEPIEHQAKGYAVEDLDQVSLGAAVVAVQDNYDEVFSIEVEPSGFVKASVLTTDLETLDVYINPRTGEELGIVQDRPAIYSFATNLHRSLFLKSIGRFFVGLISFLLVLIAITGLILLAKRQGGIHRIFSKVQKDYFELRYHVILSRWFFIPIVILASTGVYLSAEKFNLLPDASTHYEDQAITESTRAYEVVSEIPLFKNTTLDQIRKVEFPFSSDPEDYFQISLTESEIRVNQQTGAIVSEASYPIVTLISRLSLNLHTGKGSVIWSLILLLASASLLFFMYSGFVMTLKRRKKVTTPSAMPPKDTCEFVILVGSETGTCFDFARQFYNALSATGKQVYLTELNNYTAFAKAKHILIFTSTYGEGEPPTNARKFKNIFTTIQQDHTITYAVVGFGSLEYPDYCRFAIEVDALLQDDPNFEALLPLQKINNADFISFEKWSQQWSNILELDLKVEPPLTKKQKLKQIPFKVIERTDLNVDDTFLLKLKPLRKVIFTSGDLLAVFPPKTSAARQYSIAQINSEIVLSVKKHNMGRGSSFLYGLNKGNVFKAAIEQNPDFHLPKSSKQAILIANGTGIAPFLGMLDQNEDSNVHLFWGSRTQASAKIYDPILKSILSSTINTTLHTCYSREDSQMYVQDLIKKNKALVLTTINQGGTIMICGSLAMQHEVLNTLENFEIDPKDLENKGQLKMDCY